MPVASLRLTLPAAVLLFASASIAQVQQPAPDAPAPEAPPLAQPDGNGAGSANPCAGQSGAAQGGQTLTGQLSQCGGVLTPPSTGDDTQAPVPDPDPNTTPVIPPQAVPNQAPNGSSDPFQNNG